MNRILFCLALAALSISAGCSALTPPELTGRWTAKELSIQFEKDSRVTVVTRNGVSRGLYSLDRNRTPAQLVIKTQNEGTGIEAVAVYTAEFVGHQFLKLTEKQLFIEGESRERRREEGYLMERAEVLADGATLPAAEQSVSTAPQ
jgi:cell division protein ZapA (FtsZ GTPase activity inhibitor)